MTKKQAHEKSELELNKKYDFYIDQNGDIMTVAYGGELKLPEQLSGNKLLEYYTERILKNEQTSKT